MLTRLIEHGRNDKFERLSSLRRYFTFSMPTKHASATVRPWFLFTPPVLHMTSRKLQPQARAARLRCASYVTINKETCQGNHNCDRACSRHYEAANTQQADGAPVTFRPAWHTVLSSRAKQACSCSGRPWTFRSGWLPLTRLTASRSSPAPA